MFGFDLQTLQWIEKAGYGFICFIAFIYFFKIIIDLIKKTIDSVVDKVISNIATKDEVNLLKNSIEELKEMNEKDLANYMTKTLCSERCGDCAKRFVTKDELKDLKEQISTFHVSMQSQISTMNTSFQTQFGEITKLLVNIASGKKERGN